MIKINTHLVNLFWHSWKIMFKCSRTRTWILADTVFRWKFYVKRTDDNESALGSSHAVTTSSIDFNDSGMVQGVQECNLTLSLQLSPVLSERKENINQKAGEIRNIILFKHVLYAWKFLLGIAQLKRYQELSLNYTTIRGWQKQFHRTLFRKRMRHKQIMFWFRNLQDETALIPKRRLRKVFNSCIDQHLMKRYFNFWTNYYEVIHGFTRSEMHRLFQKHLK